MLEKVSIIIPTFNRAHLIKETLDSILAQTYAHWECIIIDDGSSDNTKEVVIAYSNKDSRFQFYHRPKHLLKGGNSCRNYGFKLCTGTYVNWFDSDDIMELDFIELKVKTLREGNFDFVISKCIDFDENGTEYSIFETDNTGKEITAANYTKQNINWITMAVMATKESLQQLRFNEKLRSGQEYNFFSRYLCYTQKGVFIYKVLAKRRAHSESIQGNVTKNKEKDEMLFWENTIINRLYLLQDLKEIGNNEQRQWLLSSSMLYAFNIAAYRRKIPNVCSIIYYVQHYKGVLKAFYFILALFSAFAVKRGYTILLKAREE